METHEKLIIYEVKNTPLSTTKAATSSSHILNKLFSLASAHNNEENQNLGTNRRYEQSAFGLYTRRVDKNRFSPMGRTVYGKDFTYTITHAACFSFSIFLSHLFVRCCNVIIFIIMVGVRE